MVNWPTILVSDWSTASILICDWCRRNGGFNSGGMLLPHLPHNGGSQNGSPDIR